MRLPLTATRSTLLAGLLITGLAWPGIAAAAPSAPDPAMDKDIQALEHQWAHITYEMTNSDEQFDQLEVLIVQAADVAQRYPGRAEPLIWAGIIRSEEAAKASMLNALSHAEAAKTLFEQAEQIDPTALHGAVPMSLGALYYRVPGFPVGFGDDTKARAYLEQAIAMDPDGLDANYFYGDFLMEQDEYLKAQAVLSHGLQAPADPERPVWEAGRRAEVRALLDEANRYVADSQ